MPRVEHVAISPACRQMRGDDGAFDEAVRRLRMQYDLIVRGWASHPQQPTFGITLRMNRPAPQRKEGE